MHFKKLELCGFKSFARKTEILFESGVTAVVGPNGCGKSNISDAIRWVLGEQSAKSLRGASMEDVIFNGSADSEPLNFAEVSLTLSNETRLLAVDYDEVTISRRLYRSGDSEYLLNKNLVRLKDIHELLLGTGIGTESYSVIEQGKMDAALNSKPEERRAIFEEAAGITKFKAKKKEALRKIEQTDQNLLRINDIIQEVKRQITSVERQAKKAEQYKVEFEKMKKLELAVAGREFLLFDQDRRTKEEDLAKLKTEEAVCHEVASSLESRCREKRVELERVEASLSQATAKEAMTQASIRQKQDRVLLNRERVGELAERRGNIQREIEAIRVRLSGFHAEYEKLEQGMASALEEEKGGQGVLDSAEKELRIAEEGCREVFSEESSLRQKISEADRRRAQAQADIARCRAEMAALGSCIKRLGRDQEALLAEIRDINERLSPTLFPSGANSRLSLPRPAYPAGGGQAPLAGEGASLSVLESKVREWRDRFLSLFRSWISRDRREIDPIEEAEFDKQVRCFADEVGRLQGTVDQREIESRHLRDTRSRLEARLSSLADELVELRREEEVLRMSEGQIEASLAGMTAEEEATQERLKAVQEVVRARQEAKENVLVRVAEVRSHQASFTQRREQAEKDRNWIVETERGQRQMAETLAKESEETVTRRHLLETENQGLESDTARLAAERDDILRNLEGLRLDREKILADLGEIETERLEKQKFLEEARERVHAFQMQSAEIRFAMDRLKERIFNAYQVDLVLDSERRGIEGEASDWMGTEPVTDIEAAKTEIQKSRERLNRMGPVNLVAIEEHQEMTERFNFLTQQEQDLLKAREDLQKAIQKINRTTRELFAETFKKAQGYFAEYFKLLFGGGQAELILLDESNILESGIDIIARPPGKKLQNITLLSGGEKALTAVALVFALFKVRPSPFCILDEIDAPLDESNVDRFCNVLKEFIATSQFIVITHNKRTMNLADAIYGITMAQTGISNVVSVKFPGKTSKEKSEVRAI